MSQTPPHTYTSRSVHSTPGHVHAHGHTHVPAMEPSHAYPLQYQYSDEIAVSQSLYVPFLPDNVYFQSTASTAYYTHPPAHAYLTFSHASSPSPASSSSSSASVYSHAYAHAPTSQAFFPVNRAPYSQRNLSAHQHVYVAHEPPSYMPSSTHHAHHTHHSPRSTGRSFGDRHPISNLLTTYNAFNKDKTIANSRRLAEVVDDIVTALKTNSRDSQYGKELAVGLLGTLAKSNNFLLLVLPHGQYLFGVIAQLRSSNVKVSAYRHGITDLCVKCVLKLSESEGYPIIYDALKSISESDIISVMSALFESTGYFSTLRLMSRANNKRGRFVLYWIIKALNKDNPMHNLFLKQIIHDMGDYGTDEIMNMLRPIESEEADPYLLCSDQARSAMWNYHPRNSPPVVSRVMYPTKKPDERKEKKSYISMELFYKLRDTEDRSGDVALWEFVTVLIRHMHDILTQCTGNILETYINKDLPTYSLPIIESVLSTQDVPTLATSRGGSAVLESIVREYHPYYVERVVRDIVRDNETFLRIWQHEFGNYVIGTVMDKTRRDYVDLYNAVMDRMMECRNRAPPKLGDKQNPAHLARFWKHMNEYSNTSNTS